MDATPPTTARSSLVRLRSAASSVPSWTLWILLSTCAGYPARAEDPAPEPLPYLDRTDPDYRTPRAGEGFRTHVRGREVEVEPRDRRSVTAVAGGLVVGGPEEERASPFASLYLWRRPESERYFLRATLVGLYNDVDFAYALAPDSPFEAVLTFENLTIPFDRVEWADGESLDDEELTWGWVRAGIGLGYRRAVAPGAQDNMFSVSATFEPAYFYFDDGNDTSRSFVTPQDTAVLGGRLELRWDALERNLLELAHRGYALGAEASLAWRANWEDWGVSGRETGESTPRLLTGYGVVAGGVPGVSGERHRLIGSLHAGVGDELDRFSARRLGGGPSSREYGAVDRPLVPGAGLSEFFPDHYVIGLVEYRFEPIFFTYLHLRAAGAWLDRDRLEGGGAVRRENDFLPSVGMRITTGFVLETRLQIDYDYGFELRRDGDRGQHQVVVQIARDF
jgi:hypothetical protein